MGRVAEKSPGRTRLRRRWISWRREGCEEKERRPIQLGIDCLSLCSGNSYITVSPKANCAVTALSWKLRRDRLAVMDNDG